MPGNVVSNGDLCFLLVLAGNVVSNGDMCFLFGWVGNPLFGLVGNPLSFVGDYDLIVDWYSSCCRTLLIPGPSTMSFH